jgi:hypothetical protein
MFTGYYVLETIWFNSVAQQQIARIRSPAASHPEYDKETRSRIGRCGTNALVKVARSGDL